MFWKETFKGHFVIEWALINKYAVFEMTIDPNGGVRGGGEEEEYSPDMYMDVGIQ